MPMHRWIASAAGGTSQRLNPGRATIRSRESSPGAVAMLVADIVLLSPRPPFGPAIIRAMGMERRILGAGLAALWLIGCATPSTARDSFVDGLNDVRERGCEGKRGVATPLRSQRRLDNAARKLMRSGGRLGEVLKSVDYRAMHSVLDPDLERRQRRGSRACLRAPFLRAGARSGEPRRRPRAPWQGRVHHHRRALRGACAGGCGRRESASAGARERSPRALQTLRQQAVLRGATAASLRYAEQGRPRAFARHGRPQQHGSRRQ